MPLLGGGPSTEFTLPYLTPLEKEQQLGIALPTLFGTAFEAQERLSQQLSLWLEEREESLASPLGGQLSIARRKGKPLFPKGTLKAGNTLVGNFADTDFCLKL